MPDATARPKKRGTTQPQLNHRAYFAARHAAGITTQDVAAALGITTLQMSRIEGGSAKVSADLIRQIARALHVGVELLVHDPATIDAGGPDLVIDASAILSLEQRAFDATVELADAMAALIRAGGDPDVAAHDINEVGALIHDIQGRICQNVAARVCPEVVRPLGARLVRARYPEQAAIVIDKLDAGAHTDA